jgi:rod shape-determining protein MreC
VVAQRDSALRRALEAQSLEEENERLRELLALSRRLPVRHIAAAVLHQASPTDAFTLLLSAGRDQGVRPRAPVIAPGGLLGVVRGVEAATSVAILWSHPDFRVSAMTSDRQVFGIVAPRGSDGPNTILLELRGVPYGDKVEPGTKVYTSGLGGATGVYPRGIPIGEVIAVAEEEEGWSRTYVVRPAVHPAAVSHVIILTGPALGLESAFTPEFR